MRIPFPWPRHNRTAHIRIDLSVCRACGQCRDVCPGGVLGLVDFLGHAHVHVDRPRACRGCLKCARVCPQEAIRPRPAGVRTLGGDAGILGTGVYS